MSNGDPSLEENAAQQEVEAVVGEDSDGNRASETEEPAPAGGAEAEDVTQLQAKLESMQQELLEATDKSLRTSAEMQNLRRRTERDVENAHKFGQEKLVSALLPVLDNLDRALAAVPEESITSEDEGMKSLIEGLELTRKTALDALGKFSVEVLEPQGEPFDPEFHEAMTMVPSDTAEPNTVIEVLQKGYTLSGRLLRAAMVVVSK